VLLCGITLNAQERHSYKIDLKIDFDKLTYTGVERIRWINQGEKPTSLVYFHLYPNLKTGDQQLDSDEPRIDILEVRAGADDTPLFSSLDDQGTTLRINLHESVAPEASTEIVIKFKGSVPEIDRDETSLTTHVVKQVSAALRSDRETRRARDINFMCRGVMLLGAAYPVLAVRDGDDWRRKVEPSVGDFVFNEAADYEVNVATNAGVEVFTSGTETETKTETQPFSLSRIFNRNGKSKTPEPPVKPKGPPKTVWREYFESAVVTVVMALFGMTFIVQAVKVPTGSMQNTITIGDHLLVNKFIFAPGDSAPFLPQREIRRGDISFILDPESDDFAFRQCSHCYNPRIVGV